MAENLREQYDSPEEREYEKALRPLSFDDFAGQEQILSNLAVFVKAANQRTEALDHVLLHGPAGLGKTTLAGIIASELGVNLRTTSGPVIDKPGDLAGLLTSLENRDVLFIDEIHRLSPVVPRNTFTRQWRTTSSTSCSKAAPTHAAVQIKPGSVHTYRSHHPLRTSDIANARAFRDKLPSGIFQRRTPVHHRGTLGAHNAHTDNR